MKNVILSLSMLATVSSCAWQSDRNQTDCLIILPDGTRFECGVEDKGSEGDLIFPVPM